ncbi:hypothetical protein AD929_15670 [Gluconobacter potus]|uniref:Phage protein n=1 Tax=Gluconobacter potus TaxID=2724927 RepID=A0A149QPX0_9PROT|nr:hypothetical protein [Gluconobacter potus]KXU99233.1 hypothetical protein AD929_15670 [Gluconobacter potus]
MTAPFSIGRDTRVVFRWNGSTVELPDVVSFTSQQGTVALRSVPLNSQPTTYEVPNGWSGTVQCQRTNSNLDDLIASTEAAFWSAGTITNGTLYQYITEPDGSTTTWQYTNVSIVLNAAGSWANDGMVMQSFTFNASQKVKV